MPRVGLECLTSGTWAPGASSALVAPARRLTELARSRRGDAVVVVPVPPLSATAASTPLGDWPRLRSTTGQQDAAAPTGTGSSSCRSTKSPEDHQSGETGESLRWRPWTSTIWRGERATLGLRTPRGRSHEAADLRRIQDQSTGVAAPCWRCSASVVGSSRVSRGRRVARDPRPRRRPRRTGTPDVPDAVGQSKRPEPVGTVTEPPRVGTARRASQAARKSGPVRERP